MDFLGKAMGIATIPMALLTVGSAFGGLALFAIGGVRPVALGLLAFGGCFALAPLLERVVVSIDRAAARCAAARSPGGARAIAIVSGALPMIVILAWELACFRLLAERTTIGRHAVAWLWSYGVATGPWTLFALRVSRFRRTLCGIRAYAGHLAYAALSVLAFGTGLPIAACVALMALPAILPLVVGMLLALADRDALTNVRV